MKKYTLLLILIFIFPFLLKAQNNTVDPFNAESFKNQTPAPITTPCRELYDSNSNVVIPLKGFVLIYFFSEQKKDSLEMKDLLSQLSLNPSMPYFCINIDTNKDMMRTLKVIDVPSIVILQNRRIIYATIGFTKDIPALQEILNNGIKDNLSIDKRNQ